MKYLLLLLCYCGLCAAQDFKKVTAYRIITEPDDGPCSIISYLKYPEIGVVFSAESTDQAMIKELLSTKKKAKKWMRIPFYCHEGLIGGDLFEGKAKNDTLFITNNNDLLVFPNKNIAYKDKERKIYKAFNSYIKAFFDRDFERELYRTWNVKEDTISVNTLLYKGKIAWLLKLSDIRENSKEVKLVNQTSTSVDNIIIDHQNTYDADSDLIQFKNDDVIEDITINNPVTFSIDGIKVGDDEQIVINKYPGSTKKTWPLTNKFEEMNYLYGYTIMLRDKRGYVNIEIDNKIIRRVKVTLGNS